MSFLPRLFAKRSQWVNTLDPVDARRGTHVFNRSVETQFRLAQNVEPEFLSAVQNACARDSAVQECFLLDVREPATGEIKLFIELRINDLEKQFEPVAARLQQVLGAFPTLAKHTFITVDTFPVTSEQAIFRRSNQWP